MLQIIYFKFCVMSFQGIKMHKQGIKDVLILQGQTLASWFCWYPAVRLATYEGFEASLWAITPWNVEWLSRRGSNAGDLWLVSLDQRLMTYPWNTFLQSWFKQYPGRSNHVQRSVFQFSNVFQGWCFPCLIYPCFMGLFSWSEFNSGSVIEDELSTPLPVLMHLQ